MKTHGKTSIVIGLVCFIFMGLAFAFLREVWGKVEPLPAVAAVDPSFTDPATVRVPAEALFRTGGDTSMLECYGCHDRKKPLVLDFDEKHNVILPDEHSDIVMAHGRHNRNNVCFNCHDETNLEQLQTRDHRQLKISDSADLCGSCHGPTYRDWLAGVHGRMNGYWNISLGERQRQTCVACHDPHQPKYPPRKPAPAPNPLRPRSEQKQHASAKDH